MAVIPIDHSIDESSSILPSEIFDIIIKCGKLFNDDCFIYYTRRCTVPVYNVQLDFEGRYKETLGIFSTLLSEEECSIHTFTRHLWTPHARYQSYQHFYAAYNLMRLYAHVELSGKTALQEMLPARQTIAKSPCRGVFNANPGFEYRSNFFPLFLFFFLFLLLRDSSAIYGIEKQLNIIFALV